MTVTGRWAAAGGGALTLLWGASPCSAFLARHAVCTPHFVRSSSTSRSSSSSSSTRPRAGFCMSTLTPPLSAAVEAASSAAGGGSSAAPPSGEGEGRDADADTERRWIKDMKAGQKVIGYVSDTTDFAAFVDVGVVRKGSKGKVMPVTGFLHQSEIRNPYALEGSGRAKSCEVEVKKGIHLTAYVKDVFPNAGRLTLSLDPDINKDKVLRQRDSKRQRSRIQRRERLVEKEELPEVGDVVHGYVRKVRDTTLLVDVLFAQLSVLSAAKIRETEEGGNGAFIDLAEKTKAGDVITVRIERVERSKRRGTDDEKATLGFVGWGALEVQQTGEDAAEADTQVVAAAAAEAKLESDFKIKKEEEEDVEEEKEQDEEQEEEGEGAAAEADAEGGETQ